MESPIAQSSCRGRSRDIKSYWNRKEKKECLQEDVYSSLLCWRWLYSKTTEIWKAKGLAFQDGPHNTPWTESHLLPDNTRCKESLVPSFYNFGCYSQRYCHRGDSEQVGPCDTRRQGYLGKTCPVTNNPENDGCINAVLLVWQQVTPCNDGRQCTDQENSFTVMFRVASHR